MAIKFSQFNLRTDHTSGMYLVGYDGNQNIHITVDNLFNDFISGTENTIAMFGTGGTVLTDSILSQNAAATVLTVTGNMTVTNDATFNTNIEVEGTADLNNDVNLGSDSSNLITQNGTLYLNGPIKDTTNTLGAVDQILVSDATGELTFQDLLDTHVGSAEVVKVPVKNVQGSALVKGDPVYISGSVGASGRLEVQLADSSNSAKMPAVGLLFQDLANNGEGYVVITGKLRNIANSPIDGVTPTEGDVVYVKPSGTSGAALTTTKPVYGNFIQNVGKVGRVSTNSDGTFVVSSILRSNDIPNLTPGKIWVGSTGNTIESTVVHIDEANTRVGINQTTPLFGLDVNSTLRVVGTSTLGTMDVFGNIDMNSGSINNLVDPTAAQDAATKAYVDSQVTAQDLDFQGDSGTGSIDLDSQSLDIAGGTYLTTSAASQTLTVNHDATARTDTTSSSTPNFGSSFTAVDSITTNPTGHLTAINTKTVNLGTPTWFADADTGSEDITNGTTVTFIGGAGMDTSINSSYEITFTNTDLGSSQNIFKNVAVSGQNTIVADSNNDTLTFVAGSNVSLTTNDTNDSVTINSTDQYTGTVTSVGLGTGTSGTDVNVSGSPITTSGSITLNIPIASSTNTGKLSSTDWSTFNNKQDAITNPVTGTGTATRVAFWNSSSSISSDADLYWDDTNNRLGVGTASPTTDLHVDGSALVTSNATVRGDLRIDKNPSSFPTAKLQFLRNGVTSPAMGEIIMNDNPGHAGMYMYARRSTSPYTQSYIELPTSTSYDFEINLLGHNVLTIDSYTRNVGIGTTTPASVVGFTRNLTISGSSASIVLDDTDASAFEIASSSDSFRIYNEANERMRVTSAGNVGIGATNPDDGNLQIGDSNTSYNIAMAGPRTKFGYDGSNAVVQGGGAKGVKFCVNNNTFASGEVMRITTTGDVGIGTTSPDSKLQVDGAVQVADDTDTASASKVGALRYRTSGNNSYVDMCMQTGASTYAWVNIVQNSW